MTELPPAFYLPRDDDTVESTELTRGPWDAGAQHGGPPAALLATAIETRHPDPGLQVARMTVEILGVVPLAPLRIETAVLRPGRRVELVGGSLFAGDREVLRATAWRIRRAERPLELDGLVAARDPAPTPLPPAGPELPFFATAWDIGIGSATESRFVSGSWQERGPATVWLRQTRPLLPEQEPSPLARVMLVADSSNGAGAPLDPLKWLFINPELTVHLRRPLVGEWVCLAAGTSASRDGVGLVDCLLSDPDGVLGRAQQSLLVAPRA